MGQLELGERNPLDEFGYVNLYYLTPAWRGKGLSQEIDSFAMSFLRKLGYKTARLSVSPTNQRAVQFYLKNGWMDLGERTGPELKKVLRYPIHYMEKEV